MAIGPLPPQIAKHFVSKYYHMLHLHPTLLGGFYKASSLLTIIDMTQPEEEDSDTQPVTAAGEKVGLQPAAGLDSSPGGQGEPGGACIQSQANFLSPQLAAGHPGAGER
jgi:hypothetical protein